MRMFKETGVEWIGKIPWDWEVVILKKCCDLCKGLPITKADLIKNGSPVISYGQIHSKNNKWTVISKDLIRYVDDSYNFSNPSALAQVGSIIFADTSEDYEGIGNCIYVNLEQGIFAGYHTIIVRPFNIYYPKYLAFLFQTDCWRSQLRSSASGIKVFSVTQKMLRNTTLIVPPNTKQQRIADYLDSKCSKIDTIIEKQQAIIEKLKEYKLSVITEAVTKGLKPDVEMKDSGVEWINYMPSSWCTKKLKMIVTTTKGYAFNVNDFAREGIPVVKVSDIKNGTIKEGESFISREDFEKFASVMLCEGDILMTTVGSNPNVINSAVGQLAKVSKEFAGTLLNQNIVCIRATQDCCTDYLYYFLSIKRFREHLNLIAHGTANQCSISLKDILSFIVLLPSVKEQKDIIKFLDVKCKNIEESILNRQRVIEKLLNYKKSLIYEVVTGKKEV